MRGPLGVKSLFYACRCGALWFGSEVKAVLAHPSVPRRLDCEALGHYLAFNYLPAPLTLFRHVRQVEPGHYLMVERSGHVQDFTYWDVVYDEHSARGEQAYVEEFSAILSDSVRLRLISDVPLGLFLSGGVDSSGVA